MRILALALSVGILLTGCAASDPSPAASLTVDGRLRVIADRAWEELRARHSDAARPEYEFERVITTDEWPTVIAGCMNDAGFTQVKDSGDGAILSGDIVTAQAEAYDVALYECMTRFPLDPKYNEPYSDEHLSFIYDYYIETLIPCLENEGYDVEQPPSREHFIETYNTELWTPFGELYQELSQSGDSGAIHDLQLACPDAPPTWD